MPDPWSWAGARSFEGAKLLQIAMPMGGIGAGCISLNGYGGIQDFSVRHRPALTAAPDRHHVQPGGFAVLRTTSNGRSAVRLLEGPLPKEKIYDQGLQSQGYRNVGHAGLPRMATARFTAAFPAGRVHLAHPQVPLSVTLTGWSPMIPLDDHHSSMPCAVLEYTLENTAHAAVDFELTYSLSHLAVEGGGWMKTRNHVIEGCGIFMSNEEPPGDPGYGSCALTCISGRPSIKAMWLRGKWFDWISALWQELLAGEFKPNRGNAESDLPGVNGGSIQVRGSLAPGESVTHQFVIAWHFPNATDRYGTAAENCCPGESQRTRCVWHPYYAQHWIDAADVARYVQDQFDVLRRRTFAFQRALFDSTLPAEAIDAIASNLAILKSPTVLRQQNGNVWGWEGCFPDRGCCPGTCTHVWNYAQAMSHLYPALERTLREQEYERSINDEGHVDFRAALPDGETAHTHQAAADGQLGGVLKLYRDWRICGDDPWLRRLYPLARRSLDYCISTWDPGECGALCEPHHNTYDIEFCSPDSMCTSIYVAALSAMSAMAHHFHDEPSGARYADLAKKGARYMEQHLFNGEYFHQRSIRPRDHEGLRLLVSDAGDGPSQSDFTQGDSSNARYQYGNGCLSDAVIGAWFADLYGVEHPISRELVMATLQSIHRHNFKPDLSDHVCTQRAGYATGNESGLVLCTWPHGDRPTLPFVYSDEVWTGIEYQVASHLILHNQVEAGLEIVRATRNRYDGHVRNPFNEYECGNFYARAMASYALLQALTGFAYDAVTQTLNLRSPPANSHLRTFFCAATGFGTIEIDDNFMTVTLLEGALEVAQVLLSGSLLLRDHREITAEHPLRVPLITLA